jgi:predicted metallopeptidase
VSFGSKTRAYARIWGLPGPFVRLGICEPAYVVELVYENVQGLTCERLLGVLVHELLHIPRSFSGGLRSHGEWSRWSNILGLVRGIPLQERRRLCAEARRALEEALEGA